MDATLHIAECDRTSGEVLNITIHRAADVTYDPNTLEVSQLAIALTTDCIYFVVPDGDRHNCQIGGHWAIATFPPEWQPIQPEPVPAAPNWAQFRLAMLADPGFARVISLGRVILQSSLASEINQNPPNTPSIHALNLIWNQIISEIPDGAAPTETEISAWNAIAHDASAPLVFGAGGQLGGAE